jgi:outer membrane lipoprotein SlyB
MHAACLVAEYPTIAKALSGLEILTNLDFASDAISVVSLNHTGTLEHVALKEGDAEGTRELSNSMKIGAFLGGTALAPVYLGSMIGPLMIAGPIVALIAGATAGGLLDGTLRWGINKHAAKDYEQKIKDGSVLIIVTSTPPRLDEAAASLKTTGPESLERFAYRH